MRALCLLGARCVRLATGREVRAAHPRAREARVNQTQLVSLPELLESVDLCLPSGRLDPRAVGYSRRPLTRTNLRGWGRNKHWEYWGIVTPTHVLGVTIADLDYAGLGQLYLLERATGHERAHTAVTPLGRGIELPDHPPPIRARARGRGLRLELTDEEDGTRLRGEGGGIELDLFAEAGGDRLCVVVPWSERRFQYTVKDVARSVRGSLRVDGASIPVPAGASWAVLDRGRGRWPYRITWNWGAGSGVVDGRRVGLQLGGKWTTGTGSTECALVVDGRLSYMPIEPAWSYDGRDGSRPWRVHGERVDATLTPFHVREARVEALLLSTATRQAFGTWEGWASDESGARVRLDGLVGWAEEVTNRW